MPEHLDRRIGAQLRQAAGLQVPSSSAAELVLSRNRTRRRSAVTTASTADTTYPADSGSSSQSIRVIPSGGCGDRQRAAATLPGLPRFDAVLIQPVPHLPGEGPEFRNGERRGVLEPGPVPPRAGPRAGTGRRLWTVHGRSPPPAPPTPSHRCRSREGRSLRPLSLKRAPGTGAAAPPRSGSTGSRSPHPREQYRRAVPRETCHRSASTARRGGVAGPGHRVLRPNTSRSVLQLAGDPQFDCIQYRLHLTQNGDRIQQRIPGQRSRRRQPRERVTHHRSRIQRRIQFRCRGEGWGCGHDSIRSRTTDIRRAENRYLISPFTCGEQRESHRL